MRGPVKAAPAGSQWPVARGFFPSQASNPVASLSIGGPPARGRQRQCGDTAPPVSWPIGWMLHANQLRTSAQPCQVQSTTDTDPCFGRTCMADRGGDGQEPAIRTLPACPPDGACRACRPPLSSKRGGMGFLQVAGALRCGGFQAGKCRAFVFVQRQEARVNQRSERVQSAAGHGVDGHPGLADLTRLPSASPPPDTLHSKQANTCGPFRTGIPHTGLAPT